uniref:hypothetical protein n=1 Tax=Frankia sp. Cas3 TaxID=3073926 RepID=UPI002AD4475C
TVRVSAGSGIATDAALVVPGWALAAGKGRQELATGLSLVGGAGLNAALRQNLAALTPAIGLGSDGASGQIG